MNLKRRITAKYNLVVGSRFERLMQMFEPVFDFQERSFNPESLHQKDPKDFRSNITSQVKTLNKIFKREDQIMWALKYLRDYCWYKIYDTAIDEKVEQAVLKKTGKTAKELESRAEDYGDLWNTRQDFAHYLSNAEVNQYRSILDLRFPLDATPDALKHKLEQLEQASKDDGRNDSDRWLEPLGDQKDFLRFKDGWKWVLIPQETCTLEGNAMEHCGNANPKHGDQILSLRETSKKHKKEKPHLTFILNKGVLGEMKGYANNKPSEKYHKYILPLLKDGRIKTIRGGGYRPKANFSLDDLPAVSKEELLKEKPALDFKTFLKSADSHSIVEAEGGRLTPDKEWVIVDTYDDVADFIKRNKMQDIDQDEVIYMELQYVSDDDVKEVIELLAKKHPKEFHKVFSKLVERNEKVFEEYEGFDASDKQNFGLANFAKDAPDLLTTMYDNEELDDDFVAVLKNSVRNGHEISARDSFVLTYKRWLTDLTGGHQKEVHLMWENPDNWWDSPIWVVVSVDTFIRDMEDREDTSPSNYYDVEWRKFNWDGNYDYEPERSLEDLVEWRLHEDGFL